jgi:hypothetical protein
MMLPNDASQIHVHILPVNLPKLFDIFSSVQRAVLTETGI